MWEVIFSFALSVASFILNKVKDNDAAKKRFFEFIKQAGNDLGSVELMLEGDRQLEKLKRLEWEDDFKEEA